MSVSNNNFSNDTIPGRMVRLSLLSANIEAAESELNLGTTRLNYCKGMSDAWAAAVGISGAQQGKVGDEYEDFDVLFAEGLAYYQKCKDRLIAEVRLLTDYERVLERYFFSMDSPELYADFLAAVDRFSSAHTSLKAESSPYVIDDAMVTALVAKRAAIEAEYQQFKDNQGKAGMKVLDKDALFAEHTKMLNVVHVIACGEWGKDSPKLLGIGFVPKVAQTGGQPPAKPSAEYDEETQTLTIVTDEEFTSAQAQTSDDEGATLSAPVEFAEGENDMQVLQKGSVFWARVRVRNANGFSDWSEWVIIAALILSPPGGYGYSAGTFTWVMVANATGYEMEVSYDNGGSWNQIFDGPFVVGEYTWTPPSGTHRFRIRAKGPDGLVSGWVEIEITIP